jgi:hypothetical protein
MFPLYDDKNKKIFFWSYKCGCTFVREIFYNYYLKLNYKKNYIQIISLLNRYNSIDNNKLLTYKKIYVCRNPYVRIVSCFIDKYINGHFTNWLSINIKIVNFINYFQHKKYINFTFKDFIDLVYDKIVLSKFNLLEYYHIAPQFSINYNNNFTFDKIYKLENLNDSSFLQDEFNITNPINNNSQHYSNCENTDYFVENAFELNYNELLYLKKQKKIPNYKCFFNEEIKEKVTKIYQHDISLLSKFNINYNYNFGK